MAGIVLPAAKLFMPILLTLPLFFAGLIFSSHLAKGEGLGNALSANLFGAMLGGFLEYNSMYLGLSSLYLFGGACMRVRLFACGSIARKMQRRCRKRPRHRSKWRRSELRRFLPLAA